TEPVRYLKSHNHCAMLYPFGDFRLTIPDKFLFFVHFLRTPLEEFVHSRSIGLVHSPEAMGRGDDELNNLMPRSVCIFGPFRFSALSHVSGSPRSFGRGT